MRKIILSNATPFALPGLGRAKEGRVRASFTLVELMVYMGILSVFLVILSNIFLTVLDVQFQTDITSSLEQDGRFILSRAIYDVHRATAVTTPASAGQTSQSLVLTIGGQTYTYASSSGNLNLTTSSGTQPLNSFATKLSNITVTNLGNASAKATITLNFTLTDGTVSKSYQTTISLR